ncbi:hypothetical protein D1007_07378 [Hordeum vulgare]|nr:hypothetical protein D1007_07378 [Hordeum vulgare]
MVRRLITTNVQLTPERRLQIEAEIQARRAARIAAGLPPDTPETEEEEQLKAMEEEPPGLSMAEEEAEFVVAQSGEMADQQAILDSIRDVAEVEANRRLIHHN